MIDHSITESALIDKCLAGDQQALRALYDIHGARVYCLALRLTGSAADAEDIVQDAFLRAFGALGRFRRESKFSTWLYRIVLNRCRDLLATRNRRETVTDEQWEPNAEAAPEGPDSAEKNRLQLALSRLPEGMREVLIMHDVLGMEHEEIAQSLKVNAGTSKSQLHKARAKMREYLSGKGGSA